MDMNSNYTNSNAPEHNELFVTEGYWYRGGGGGGGGRQGRKEWVMSLCEDDVTSSR